MIDDSSHDRDNTEEAIISMPHGLLDETHDPAWRSWVAAANLPGTDFPIQNLPLGVFSRGAGDRRGCVAIGDQVLDLAAGLAAGLFEGEAGEAAHAGSGPVLNPLLALGRGASRALRRRVSAILAEGSADRAVASRCLVPMAELRLHRPVEVGNFTDFMASRFHTARMGAKRDPANPLPPSFLHLPIAYHSRATTVRVSGEAVARPHGQSLGPDGKPRFGPVLALDFELEFGAVIGPANRMGDPIPVARAGDALFGFCLVNDWSARDVQRFEMMPLGPFLSKSLSTTISPWIVTAEALAPFAAPAFARFEGDPEPLPYLVAAADQAAGGLDVSLDCWMTTPRMRTEGAAPARIVATSARHLHWTFAQMVAHHTSNGCDLRTGDLLASGTVSGPEAEGRACLAEVVLEDGGLTLPNGERRTFLEDGDEVWFTGRAERAGYVPIGFGECRARIDPAKSWPMG
jgi:fumarylacetoacetase